MQFGIGIATAFRRTSLQLLCTPWTPGCSGNYGGRAQGWAQAYLPTNTLTVLWNRPARMLHR